jgi:DNA-binding IscR family transcriptional regulator
MLDVRDAIAHILDQTTLADLQSRHDAADIVLLYDI